MGHRDITLDALSLGGTVIPLGGDGEAVRIVFGDQASATRGIATTVFNIDPNPDATLTITQLPEDPGYRVLLALYRARKALPIRTPMPGVGINGVTGETVEWADSEFVSIPDFILAKETQAVTAVLPLHGVNRTPPVL